MADTVRALIAMVAMGATQKPELSDLVSGIRIAQQGPEVRMSVRVSHDTLARLQARPTPSPTPASRPAPRPPAKK
jgi:hypothetical protein